MFKEMSSQIVYNRVEKENLHTCSPSVKRFAGGFGRKKFCM